MRPDNDFNLVLIILIILLSIVALAIVCDGLGVDFWRISGFISHISNYLK